MNQLLKEFLSYVLEARKKPQNTTPKEPEHKVGDIWQSPKTKKWTAKRADRTQGGFTSREAAEAWLSGKGKASGQEEPTGKKPEELPPEVVRTKEPERYMGGKQPKTITPDQVSATVDAAYTDAESDSRVGKLFGYVARKASQVRRMMALKAFETTIETRLPADKKEQGKRLAKGIQSLLAAHAQGDTKTAERIVRQLQDEFKFYSNSSGTSFKTQAFGMGERHFVGKTVLAKDLVELFDKYRPKGTPSIKDAEDQDGVFKGKLEGASKPRIGEVVTRTTRTGKTVTQFIPDSVSAVDSPRVNKILATIPIPEKFKALYGPKDETGDLLDNTGGKNSREYFKHSLTRNASLDQTAQALEAGGFPEMAKSVLDHKKRMEEIEQNWDSYTPEEREKAVQQSYSDMAVRLHSTALGGDSEMCNAIMKNLAEMSLYESELAGGKEVYLPASGSFPAADKLIRSGGGTKAERIDKISVKYGKSGKVYGMPAQSSTIALMHKDPFYHGLTGGRVGVEGNETGVSSRVLERKNWGRLMEESGYGSCLKSKKSGENIRAAFEQSQTVIAEERAKLKPQPPDNKAIARMMKENKNIQKARDAVGTALEAGIDKDKLLKHGGEERVALLSKPFAFASMMTMDATIVSSKGLPDLKHAHMEMIDEDGDGTAERMGTEVEDGDAVLPNWHYGWREADERGGGLLVGFARPTKTTESPSKRR